MTVAAGGPSFVLSGPTGTVAAHGIGTAFADIDEARAALQRGQVPIVVGALPFDTTGAAALHAPKQLSREPLLPPRQADPPPPRLLEASPQPDPGTHRDRVAAAVARLRADGSSLHKVVLARALRLHADAPWDPSVVLRRLLAADPGAYGYLVDLSPAGPRYAGVTLVGASPELLVARAGEVVRCRPFAGSAPRSADPAVDRANGAALVASAKDRHEHQLVIDVMRTALEPLCVELQIADEPELHHTDALWHLNTPITARLRESSTTAMDLALALQPTPAVGGVPTAAATALIGEIEGDRGFYAGAAGWCDARGDGRWVVSIRCAQLSADRRSALAHSGGGIVAESNPDDEVAETTTKFKTILAGLGVTL
ncbi:isochorismate synthase [[Mycobacterium] burgundiense]|uniref:isochorismate synthase n=1 Tax=[Mycobacterium] burgundiense TaxID=3064286 RepID=A0ABN9NN53_9MYCO|nr:isochorismate synthase [Mycolicibacterium sp. MU0053]CAJ1507437.1 isochorismate synthase [Mycolicibacterium sp. MU0053]